MFQYIIFVKKLPHSVPLTNLAQFGSASADELLQPMALKSHTNNLASVGLRPACWDDVCARSSDTHATHNWNDFGNLN